MTVSTVVWRIRPNGQISRLGEQVAIRPDELLGAEVGGVLVMADATEVARRAEPDALKQRGATRRAIQLGTEEAERGLRLIGDDAPASGPGWRVESLDGVLEAPLDPIVPADPAWGVRGFITAVGAESEPNAPMRWRVRSVPPIIPSLSPADAVRQTLQRLEVMAGAGSTVARLAWRSVLGPLPPTVLTLDPETGRVSAGATAGRTVLIWDARPRGGDLHVAPAPSDDEGALHRIADAFLPVLDGAADAESLPLPTGSSLRLHPGAAIEDPAEALPLASWSSGMLSWTGALGARERMLERARELFPETDAAPDPFAVDVIEHTVLYRRSGAEGPLTPEVREAIGRVSYDQVLRRSYGAQILTRLLLERALDERIAGAPFDAALIAEGLTAYAMSVLERMTETAAWYRTTICRLVTQFLRARRQQQDRAETIPAELTATAEWELLWRRAPWLLLFAPPSADPPRVDTSGADLLDILTLTRPTHGLQHLQAGSLREARFRKQRMSTRWLSLFQLVGDEVPTLQQLEALADATVYLPGDPAVFARRQQALDLPEVLREAARARSHVLSGASTPEQVLALRTDTAETPSVMVVNLSEDTWLRFRVDDASRNHLEVSAVPTPHASGYASAVFPIRPDSVLLIEDAAIPLVAEERPLAPLTANLTGYVLPPDVFRGREQQLAQLRLPLETRGPKLGSLIHGTRRSGKSTLAYQAGEGRARRLVVDLSDAAVTAGDHREWQAEICALLAGLARRQLGVELSGRATTDVVWLIRELDEALHGSPPIVLMLDEFDMLLLPGQGAEGPRTAGRIGNLVLENIALIACVQRFHADAVELKSWQRIRCPADLHWGDGVTYFFPALKDRRPGPRVEWLDRVSVTPYLFEKVIAPKIGMRPYFWAQLHNRLDRLPRLDPDDSRLIDRARLRAAMVEAEADDPHLAQLLEPGNHMSAVERRRSDLLSQEELTVLTRLAHRANRNSETTEKWLAEVAGVGPVRELIDRAILEPSDIDGELRFAVPIYGDYLRRVTSKPTATRSAV